MTRYTLILTLLLCTLAVQSAYAVNTASIAASKSVIASTSSSAIAASPTVTASSTNLIKDIAENSTWVLQIITSIVGIIIVVVIAIYLFILAKEEVQKDSIVIEPFDMPEELIKEGFTGKAIALEVVDKLHQVWTEAQTNNTLDRAQVALPEIINSWQIDNIEVSAGGFSIKSLRKLFYGIKKLFKKKTFVISGEVQLIDTNTYGLIIRCNNGNNNIVHISDKKLKTELQNEFVSAAEKILIKLYPVQTLFYLLYRPQKAAEIVQIARQLLANNDKQISKDKLYLAWGVALNYLGLFEEAIDKYENAAKINPDNAKIYINWGVALDNLGEDKDGKDAIDLYKKAIQMNPHDKLAYFNLATMLAMKLKRYSEARQYFQELLNIDPYDMKAHVNLGSTFAFEKDYDSAIKHFKIGLSANPNVALIYMNWGITLMDISKNKNEEESEKLYKIAIEKFEKANNLNITEASCYYNWGLAIFQLAKNKTNAIAIQQINKAIEKFRKASEIDPNDAETYFQWGIALINIEEYIEAAQKFETAAMLNPKILEIYFNWGIALVKNGNYLEAKKKFQYIQQNSKDTLLLDNVNGKLAFIEEKIKNSSHQT